MSDFRGRGGCGEWQIMHESGLLYWKNSAPLTGNSEPISPRSSYLRQLFAELDSEIFRRIGGPIGGGPKFQPYPLSCRIRPALRLATPFASRALTSSLRGESAAPFQPAGDNLPPRPISWLFLVCLEPPLSAARVDRLPFSRPASLKRLYLPLFRKSRSAAPSAGQDTTAQK